MTTPPWSDWLTPPNPINEENAMTDSTDTEALPIDAHERVVITTDGGVGGRGRAVVVLLTPEDSRRLREQALAANKA